MRRYLVLPAILYSILVLIGCSTGNKAKQSSITDEYNVYGETPFITAIKDRDTRKILQMLNSDRMDISSPDQNGVPPVLVAIKVGIDLNTLDAIIQKTPLAPKAILDKMTKNAYDYVRDYRNNNPEYLEILDKYQKLRG